MDRHRRGRFELGPQPADVDIDRPRVALVVRAPDAIQQLASGVRPARMGGEHGQELVLLGPQVDQLAVPSDLVGDGVEDQARPGSQPGRGARPCARVEELETAQELIGVDGGRQRLVEAAPERVQRGVDVVRPRDVDDAQARPTGAFPQREGLVGSGRRRGDQDRDVRPTGCEQGAERARVGDDAEAASRARGSDGPAISGLPTGRSSGYRQARP